MKILSILVLLTLSLSSHASYWQTTGHGSFLQSSLITEADKYPFYGYSKINLIKNKTNPLLMAKSSSNTSVYYQDQITNSGQSRGFGKYKNYGIKGIFGYSR